MADAAEAMAERGYRVHVLTSAAGYENPHVKYKSHEDRAGVQVRRLPLSSFGKRSLFLRLLGQCLFLLQVIIRGIFARPLNGILVSTSPPMAAFGALVISCVRRVPITYWLMDLNPDQTVALGRASALSPLVMAMKLLNRGIFARASAVIVLDKYMANRVERQYHVRGRIVVLPPWPHHEEGDKARSTDNPFIAEHNRQGRFVVMYSGNHSLASPVTTLVQAALRLRDDPRFLFLFVGGGLGKREVEDVIAAHCPTNIVSLPYQPLELIKYSLSAADLHIVTLGDNVVGINHPCKIYGAMAVARPVLLIGPRPSHAADLIDRHNFGSQINNGDVQGTMDAIRHFAQLPQTTRLEMGRRAVAAVRQDFSKSKLRTALCDIVERSLASHAAWHTVCSLRTGVTAAPQISVMAKPQDRSSFDSNSDRP
jgi:glycosyltransferase involved in cell wall biosynthesis